MPGIREVQDGSTNSSSLCDRYCNPAVLLSIRRKAHTHTTPTTDQATILQEKTMNTAPLLLILCAIFLAYELFLVDTQRLPRRKEKGWLCTPRTNTQTATGASTTRMSPNSCSYYGSVTGSPIACASSAGSLRALEWRRVTTARKNVGRNGSGKQGTTTTRASLIARSN